MALGVDALTCPPCVDVFALPTGKLYLPDRWLFEDGDNDMLSKRQFSPDFSFLICHSSGKRVLFDLGLKKVGHSPFRAGQA